LLTRAALYADLCRRYMNGVTRLFNSQFAILNS
jgi:hypothetical protein